jgi:hypothetical protein
MHDCGNVSEPGVKGPPSVYPSQLLNITEQLKAKEPQAKLLYALTSPDLCQVATDDCVQRLNRCDNGSFEPFYIYNCDLFTKTGSGQT